MPICIGFWCGSDARLSRHGPPRRLCSRTSIRSLWLGLEWLESRTTSTELIAPLLFVCFFLFGFVVFFVIFCYVFAGALVFRRGLLA